MNDLVSLSDLFVSKLFRIPDYQRGYAWGETQINDFWEDIINLTDDRFHYTGMLSLKELTKEDTKEWKEEKWILEQKKYKAFHVVDGQQRLTTFIVFLNSMIQFCQKQGIEYLNSESIEQIKEKYIVEYQKPQRLMLAYKFGYETDNPSFEYLRYCVLSEESSGSVQETFYTLNLENAKKTFDKRIEDFFKKNGEEGLNELYSKLVNRLQFNIHYIDDDFDVFVAFETMNNRGKKLSNLEILKNRLIYLTTIYNDKRLDKDNKDELRRKINDAWKEVYFELGRNRKKPLNDDEYLKGHWTMYFSYSRSKGDDYIVDLLGRRFNPKAVFGIERTIKYEESDDSFDEEHVPQEETFDFDDEILTPAEIKDYVTSLKTVAKYWYYSFNPYDSTFNATEDEKKWIDKLNRIGINYFRTTVVASFLCNSTSEQRVELFKTIERFIFLCFRMARYQASYFSASGYRYGRELLHNTMTIEDVTKEIQEKFEANISEATATFLSKISGSFKNGNGYYDWYDLHYFLFEYEAKLAEDTSITKMDDWSKFTKGEKDKISIEHVFPQTPTRWYWRNQFRDYSKEEQRALAGSLGNLLPLSQSINSSLQNDEFELKKNTSPKRNRAYCNGSNSEIEVSRKVNWNPTEIKERGLHLLTFMEERWGFKFDEALDRLDLLGIPFMAEERVPSPELEKDDIINREQEIDEEGSIKLSEYLKDKKPEMKELYQMLYQALKEKMGPIVEVANTVFVGWRKRIEGTNFVDVWIQSSQLKLIINKPLDPKNLIGEELAESYNWSKMYNVSLRKQSEIERVVEALIDSANQVD